MSEVDAKVRTRSQMNSKENSKRGSRDSSREPSTSRSKVGQSDSDKIKGILKAHKRGRGRSPSESGLTSAAESSAANSETDVSYDTADEESEQGGGILPTLKNLQYGTHVALRGKGKQSVLRADRLIKRDSNKNLVEALQKERVKGAEMFAALLDGGLNNIDQDVPHFKPFNKRLPACSADEFDRQLKSIQRNYPRFEGKCAEFLYFLMEVEALKNSLNITDEQLTRLLQNRLAGRLQRYFMIEMKREKNVVKVLNRLGRDYVETIDTAAEIEKCASFRFQFKNVADELTRLKESMALAYPHMTPEGLRQTYIQKVTDKLPTEVRLALVDEFERQRQREELGMAPLSDHEIDAKIIRHCKALERKQQKPIYKVKANVYSSSYQDSVTSDDSISLVNSKKDEKSLLEGFVKSVQQLAVSAARSSEDKPKFERGQGGGAYQKGSSTQPHEMRNKGKDFHPHNNGQRPPWQKRGDLFEQPNFSKSRSQGNFRKNGQNERPPVVLAKSSDPQYPNLIKEIKSGENIKFLGQKIKNDFRGIKNENFKNSLKQLRPQGAGVNPIYEKIDGRYKVDNCPMITCPIVKKVGNYPPQLTAEVLKRFAGRCHACGFDTCPKKGSTNDAPFKCIYENKADSWWPCEKCMRGFHLSKDCMALIKN
jgi:hypothetical protein